MIISKLTDIEFSLLMFLIEGKTSKEIAKLWGKTKNTIDHQIEEMRKKTGNSSRTGMVADYLQSATPDCIQEEIDLLTAKIAKCEAEIRVYQTLQEIKQAKLKAINEALLSDSTTDTL